MRKFLFGVILMCFILPHESICQDSRFYKKKKSCEINVIKDGLHLVFLFSSKHKVDTVFTYEYGAYLGVRVLEAARHKDHFICIYELSNIVVCASFQYHENKWTSSAGGMIFNYNSKIPKIDSIKMNRNRIVLKAQGHIYKYKIDFEKKVLQPPRSGFVIARFSSVPLIAL